jgi:uncharacterized membrane protein
MSNPLTFLPVDFGWANAIAIALIFALWGFYSRLLSMFGKGSLNTQLHFVRQQWFQVHHEQHRRDRVFDAILLGHISNSISFFGSATLLVLAGLVGSLLNVNRIYIVAQELKFLAPMTADIFTLYFAILTLILALCFFAFTYAQRKMSYTFALLGGLDEAPADTLEARIMAEQAATVLTEAVRSINNGIRGFYYAVASLFLFGGPVAAICATLVVTAVLYYRQLLSPTAVAIGKYVDALKRIAK